ncbi:hypothetical protein SAMN04489867_3498 [Pedococcus dokdonensis]|uniref:Lipoprotein n=1 Tax=Pedococcus dokdonensis TaxID=443156 RepID=A0A1H0UTI4_9MICO|nr:hypothetical protein [Pedococcus dokdonensis]SDP69490.1 hypothetical protein SAMN04489867_3498 [Pedococcus dokdonensis]
MKLQHHARATTAAGALAALAAATLLSACGSDTPGAGGNVTVTVTPTVTAKPPSGSKTSSAPKTPKSDVKGRDYDYGVVTKTGDVGGVGFIELDRWTWKKLDDAKLAKDGVPLDPFKGKVPYENQNAKLTYTIPLADGVRILYHHCIAADQPLQTKSVDAAALKGLADRENTVLVQIDDQGAATTIQNIPGCPG